MCTKDNNKYKRRRITTMTYERRNLIKHYFTSRKILCYESGKKGHVSVECRVKEENQRIKIDED